MQKSHLIQSILCGSLLSLSTACATQSGQSLDATLKNQGYHALSLTKNATNHFEVRAKINGKEASFIVDSGASGTVLDLERSKAFKIDLKKSDEKAAGLGTQSQTYHHGILKTFVLGDVKRKDFQVAVMDLSAVNAALSQQGIPPKDGVIGADLLQDGEAILDYANDRLYLKAR